MRIISIALAKGGVGKTTTAVNLAAGLASSGRRVLLIDTDTQNQAARALGVKTEHGLYDYVKLDQDVSDVLVEARPSLYLMAGGDDIARLTREFGLAEYEVEQQLKKALAPLEGYFHYVLIDGSPGWDLLAINVLFYAKEILCPVSLEGLAFDGLISYLRRNQRMRERSGIDLRYILPTMVDSRLAQSDEILGTLKKSFGDAVCDPVRRNVRLSESAAHGRTIFEYAPRSNGAADYKKLVERVIADE